MKVLIVDDEKTIRETLKEILEDEGFQVFTEEVGSRTLQKIKEILPDVVVLDIFLPGISGLEVLEKLKEEGLTKNLAVVIVSGHGSVETAVRAIKLGAFDFIEKPVKYDKFVEVLKAAAKRKGKANGCNYSHLPLKKAKEEFEKDYIKQVLERFNWDLKKSANFMEIDISNLYRKLNKYKIAVK